MRHRLLKLVRDVLPAHPGTHRCKHIAVIYEGNTIHTIGFNQAKSHPLQARYGANEHKIHLHAEIDAIVKATRKRVDLSRCGIFVVRFHGDVLGESRPCAGCAGAISTYGFREVQWSTRAGTVEMT